MGDLVSLLSRGDYSWTLDTHYLEGLRLDLAIGSDE